MHTLTRSLFRRLTKTDDDSIVSIHLPTHRAGRQTVESRIHLKNALDDARKQLAERIVDEEVIDERLRPLLELTEERDYWQHQSEGLSLFQFGDTLIDVPVGEITEPFVQVAPHAHVVPLVSALAATRPFAALVLSENRVALFTITGEEISEVDEPELVKDFEALGKYIDDEKQLQFHTRAPQAGTPRSRNAVFHGQGVGTAAETKTRLAEFARLVDDAVTKHFRRANHMPLVVIAAEPVHAIYMDACRYAHLLRTEATGNADHLVNNDILGRARTLADPALHGPARDALNEMKEKLGSDHVVFEMDDVLNAAADGRLSNLLGASDRHVWGRADLAGAARDVEMHDARRSRDEDLQNLAFVLAARTGASLHALPKEDMPVNRPLLGLRRF